MLLHLLTIDLLVCKKRCILSNISAQLVHLQPSSGYTSLQLGGTRPALDPHLEVLAPAQYELTPQSNLLASRLLDRLQSATATCLWRGDFRSAYYPAASSSSNIMIHT